MLGLKLNYVSKRSPRTSELIVTLFPIILSESITLRWWLHYREKNTSYTQWYLHSYQFYIAPFRYLTLDVSNCFERISQHVLHFLSVLDIKNAHAVEILRGGENTYLSNTVNIIAAEEYGETRSHISSTCIEVDLVILRILWFRHLNVYNLVAHRRSELLLRTASFLQ